VTPDEAWFCLSMFRFFIFLLITNQFGSVQKMMLHKGRDVSEDHANRRLEPTQISLDGCPTKAKGRKSNVRPCISLVLSSCPEIFAPYQENRRRDFVIHAGDARSHCAKRSSVFGSQLRNPSTSSSLFARSDPLRLLAFRGSERSASREPIRQT
jgi:hypothetical protein